MIQIFHTYLPGWDVYDLDLSYIFTSVGSVRSAGSAICPRVIVIHQYLEYHTGTGSIIGTRTVRVLYEVGITYDMTARLGGCRSWCLPIKLPCTHCPTLQAHNHVELKQGVGISMEDVAGSSCSGSAAADDLSSGQQGGSSADPGVDTTDLFLPRIYVFLV